MMLHARRLTWPLGRSIRSHGRFITTTTEPPRAALCVIGNEVLSGKIQDTNSHFVANFMFERGVDLSRIVVIPDEIDTIASTVKDLSELVGPSGYVITTGGIGPTHDDITYEGVAKAFGRGVELHEPTLEKMSKVFAEKNVEVTDSRKRMAILPENCQVLDTGMWVPLAYVHNVYVLPGIPSIVKEMLHYNKDHFTGIPIHRSIVHTMLKEGELAEDLTAIQNAHPTVSIGSYVNLTKENTGVHDASYSTKLTIDGRDEVEVEEIVQKLIKATNGYQFTTD